MCVQYVNPATCRPGTALGFTYCTHIYVTLTTKGTVMFNSANVPALKVVPATKTNLKHMSFAMGEIGQKEVTGVDDNSRILEYFEATSLNATHDEVPWCSAFVNFVLKSTGTAGTNSAMALSFKTWGKPTKTPSYGDIVIFDHGGGRGHVGFYVGTNKGQVSVLGGNQNNAVNILQFQANSVAQYRTPKTGWKSTTVLAAATGGVVSAGAAVAGAAKLATGGAVVTAVTSNGTTNVDPALIIDGVNAVMPYLSPDLQSLLTGIVGTISFVYVMYKRLLLIKTQQQ